MLLALVYRLIISSPESTRLGIGGGSSKIWRNVDTSAVHGTCGHVLTVAEVADAVPGETVEAVVLGAVVRVR